MEYPDSSSVENSYEHLICVCSLMRWVVNMLAEHSDRLEEWTGGFAEALSAAAKAETVICERSGSPPSLAVIRERFGLNEFEQMCVWLALAAELDENLAALLRRYTGGDCPHYGLALSVYSLVYPVDESLFASRLPGSPLNMLMDSQPDGALSEKLRLRREVLYFATGRAASFNPRIRLEAGPAKLPELYPEQTACAVRLIECSSGGKQTLIGMDGDSYNRVFVSRVCAAAGRGFVFVDLPPEPDDELAAQVACLCVLTDAIPAVYAAGTGKNLSRFVKKLPLPTVFILGADKEITAAEGLITLALPKPSPQSRTELWRLQKKDLDLNAEILGERYRLTAGQISSILETVLQKKAAGFSEACDMELVRQEISLHNMGSVFCRLIQPAFTLDDLICDEKTKGLLRQVCAEILYRPRLYAQPHFNKLFPYGRGLGVLLHGASGTGKTMAVQAVAAEVGLDVMAVDLSLLMDKYIGETEKHMTEIFERAQANNCILFFDEADALFSKRTNVSDAHDRHANSQTAHLLQKMEQYDGVVMLASNLPENVDDAFKRRLRFIIGFGRPDADMREELWRRFCPVEVDFKYLADTFALTPAIIKWAVLSAAVRSEAEGVPLSMSHLLDALRYEYDKMGLAFPERDFIELNL